MSLSDLFAGRRLCIASMHKKERAIAPVLGPTLGLDWYVCKDLDTDLFGTFSGEITRRLSPAETARSKCLAAMELSGADLVVASEGSFGPHPGIGLLGCDEELLYFFDSKNNLEICVKELSLQTNFSSCEVQRESEIWEFAAKVGFPAHALVLKDHEGKLLRKGIRRRDVLQDIYGEMARSGLPLRIETDMRAHMNPSRMQVIGACAEKLLAAIRSACPACAMPGFVVQAAVPGLPCEHCGMPTRSTIKHVYECTRCAHKREVTFPYKKQVEEARFCDFCNP